MIIGKNSIQANIKINYFLKYFMNIKAYCIFQELLTISNDLNKNLMLWSKNDNFNNNGKRLIQNFKL